MALTDKLRAIGDAIRVKTGKSDPLTLDQMPNEIASIKIGGSYLYKEHEQVVNIATVVSVTATDYTE